MIVWRTWTRYKYPVGKFDKTQTWQCKGLFLFGFIPLYLEMKKDEN